MNIGERIKQRRLTLGMTLLDVANRIGRSEATVQRYESGVVKNLPHNVLVSLAMALRTTPDWLVGIDQAEEAAEWYTYTSQLTPFDAKLLNNFHNAEDGTKKAVCKLLDVPVTGDKLKGQEPYVNTKREV